MGNCATVLEGVIIVEIDARGMKMSEEDIRDLKEIIKLIEEYLFKFESRHGILTERTRKLLKKNE